MQPKQLFEKLFAAFGEQYWWPAEQGKNREFEICVGAILTQNTAWGNVEKALQNLKKAKMLSCSAIANARKQKIAKLIRSSGYFNQKAERLQLFCRHIESKYNGSLKKMLSKPVAELRKELLSLKGIGKETADSILLYAANKPVFVIDAYTKRLAERLKLHDKLDYDSLQAFFESALERNAQLFNEFHALIVRFCKQTCKKEPLCTECFLRVHCYYCLVQ